MKEPNLEGGADAEMIGKLGLLQTLATILALEPHHSVSLLRRAKERPQRRRKSSGVFIRVFRFQTGAEDAVFLTLKEVTVGFF